MPFDVGILFVHGIGTQERGQTLAGSGEPVHDWLADRLRGLDRRWREAIADQEDDRQRQRLQEWRDRVEARATDGFPSTGPLADEDPDDPHDAEESGDGGESGVEDDADDPLEPDPELLAELADRVGSRTLVGRIRFTDTLIGDPDDPTAPAHAKLRFDRLRDRGEPEEERWLLAESWWAETFAPPDIKELIRWGLRTIPWTLGSHFGAQVRRVLEQRPEEGPLSFRWFVWLGRLAAAALRLAGAVLASPLLLAALGVLALGALIPIPQVREALRRLQLQIASTLGDSYMLVSHPIHAASIVGQVRRDLAWLAERCDVVAVVAHSQGAAVAHRALREDMPAKLELLFTFGSGLKKLEQVEHLMSSGHSYRRSALLTLVALPLSALALAWFGLFFTLALTGQGPEWNADLLSGFASVGGVGLVSLLFLGAGLRDYVRGFDLSALRRWICRLNERAVDWLDCFATADPVSNGALFDDPMVERSSVEVCNASSILSDHTSYWRNRDQFLTLLIDRLVQPQVREGADLPPAPELAIDPEHLEWTGRRRRWRVGISSAIGWIAILSVLLVAWEHRAACRDFLLYWLVRLSPWGANLPGEAPVSPGEFSVAWRAMGALALVLIPYWITRVLWRTWNEAEMRNLVELGKPLRNTAVAVGMTAQLLCAAGIVYGDAPPLWLFFVALFGVSVSVFATQPSAPPAVRRESDDTPAPEATSRVDSLRESLRWRYEVFFPPFVLGMAFWALLVAVGARLFDDGVVLGFRPGDLSSLVFGAVVGTAVLAWRELSGRVRRGS